MILLNSRKIFYLLLWMLIVYIATIICADKAEGRLYIDITSPSIRKISIAVPDFKYIGEKNLNPYPNLMGELNKTIRACIVISLG